MPSYINNGIANQTSATYNVTGTAAGGTCNIGFQVVEDRRSVTLSRSITFNSELPPFLRADVIGDQTAQTKVPAQFNVTLVINATKLDAGNTLDVTFPREVTSSGGCVATLASGGSPILQYAGINGMPATANSTAAATYNVRSPNIDIVSVVNCGTFLFDVTEGSATVTTPLNPGISFDEATNKDLAPTVTTNPVGGITRFPDDGEVIYTLNLTKRDILTDSVPMLNTTATITGSCSIAPTGVTSLTYDGDNQASTDYAITYTGTKTVGGSCDVEFVATEDGEATTITRSITFSAEQAPALVASLVDNGIDVSSTESVRVNVTATKQDGSNTPSITFPASVVSSACTATLDGDVAREYVMNVTSSVSVIYNVRPTIRNTAASCGSFIFTATEGSATRTESFPSGINFIIQDSDNDGIADAIDNCPMIANPVQTDTDGDAFGNPCDVDADGDGLIEISTVAQLNMMRYNLAGTNLTITADATGNSMGCGGGRHANGTAITACNGYEQMANYRPQ